MMHGLIEKLFYFLWLIWDATMISQNNSTYTPQSNPPCPTLFVANLGPKCSEQELAQVFSRLQVTYIHLCLFLIIFFYLLQFLQACFCM